jgi:hypothetical protein
VKFREIQGAAVFNRQGDLGSALPALSDSRTGDSRHWDRDRAERCDPAIANLFHRHDCSLVAE